jgi:hypothetical protein
VSRRAVAAAALFAALAFAGCRPAVDPVAELATSPERIELAWPAFAELEIALRPTAALPAERLRPIVFVHLLDEPGSVLRTFDHDLAGEWRVDRELRYRIRLHQSALAEPLAPGDYLISLGLYHPDHGRFALTGTEEISRQEYRVARVAVPAVAPDAPRARFSAQWLPPVAGIDRQVLARRHLSGGAPGRVEFGPIGGGTLALVLEVPSRPKAGTRMELLDGAGQPRVRVSNDCGAAEAEITGTGRFDVDLAVPAAAPRDCGIVVDPNFRITSSERAETTSVVLEAVSWRPEPGGRPPG